MMQLVWLSLLAVHTGAAAVWWWLMPGANQIIPPLVVLVFLTALFARGRFAETILPPVLAIIPFFWMAFGISARLTFVESFRALWNLPFLGGGALAVLWVRRFRFRVRPV